MQSQSRGRLKKVFPGANTPEGFFSFYDYMIDPDGNMIIIIKGGPGIGKSTLIKRIGTALLDMGYDTEYACCSQDAASYDGVVVPKLGLALFDGTPPHILEPRFPGIVEHIINLGDFLNKKKLRTYRQEIVETLKEVSTLFERAFRYLKEARIIHDDWEACYFQALDLGCLNCMAEELGSDMLHGTEVSRNPGRPRHLFASAVTASGPINHLQTVIGHMSRRYILSGEPGTGKSTIVKKVAETALCHGLDVEIYHCPLDPSKTEHIVIPELEVALVSSSWPHLIDPMKDIDRIIETRQAVSDKTVAKYDSVITDSKQRFHQAFQRAIEFLKKAKQEYDKVQAIYSESMDFPAVERLGDRILGEVLELERKVREATA
jgi:ABC-type phosphate/phosphonate transport system ATPase subunit